jgi:8-oxo-dGTP pyrophosphatase MutT (NUDIX family)
MWSFCGGSQEFGESVVECAIREAKEETGLVLKCNFPESKVGQLVQPEPRSESRTGQQHTNHSPKAFILSDTLEYPVPFTAVDVIDGPSIDDIRYHYSIVEVAATPLDPLAPVKAADDADEAAWFPCDDLDALRSRQDIVCNAVDVIELALQRFRV